MAFAIDPTVPGDADIVSTFPAIERTFRSNVELIITADHDEATGDHTTITIQQRSGDPSGETDKIHLYVKEVSGTAELFVRDEAGNVMQVTTDGEFTSDAVFRTAGSTLAQRTMAALLLMENTIAIQMEEAGGTARDVLKMTAGDVLQVGNTTTVTLELLVNDLATLLARTGAGTFRVLTVADEGSGNGLDADTVDTLEGATLLSDDSSVYFESIGIALAAGMDAAITHSLGGVPRLILANMRCTTAEHGYSIDDRIPIAWNFAPIGGEGLQLWATSTEIGYVGGNAGGSNTFQALNKTSGAVVNLTKTSWVLDVFAWK